MQHISELTNSISPQPSRPASTTTYSEQSKQNIKELFVLMKATWGNKYTSQFTTPEDVRVAMRVWLQAFHDIESRILRRCIERLAFRLEWPPSIEQMAAEIRLIRVERAPIERALPRLAMKGRQPQAAIELGKMRALLKS